MTHLTFIGVLRCVASMQYFCNVVERGYITFEDIWNFLHGCIQSVRDHQQQLYIYTVT